MADDWWHDLVERSVRGDVTQGTMFGSKGLRTGKKFFAVWWHGQLVLKLPPPRIEELVAAGSGTLWEPMEGRPMNGWIVVDSSADWSALSAEALAFLESQL